MSKILDRSAILGADDLPIEMVDIPEWGGSVYVRALTGAERDQLERMISKDSVSRAAIAALVMVDSEGKQLFSQKDVAALADKHGSALERVVNAALAFNSMTEDAIEAGKDG
jgi:hypothetical protein